MSKVANLIKMIWILQNQKITKIESLANELEVSARQIRRYRDELELAGVYIDSITGRYGGYVIKDRYIMIDNKSPDALIDLDFFIKLFGNLPIEDFDDIRINIALFKDDETLRKALLNIDSYDNLLKMFEIRCIS